MLRFVGWISNQGWWISNHGGWNSYRLVDGFQTRVDGFQTPLDGVPTLFWIDFQPGWMDFQPGWQDFQPPVWFPDIDPNWSQNSGAGVLGQRHLAGRGRSTTSGQTLFHWENINVMPKSSTISCSEMFGDPIFFKSV